MGSRRLCLLVLELSALLAERIVARPADEVSICVYNIEAALPFVGIPEIGVAAREAFPAVGIVEHIGNEAVLLIVAQLPVVSGAENIRRIVFHVDARQIAALIINVRRERCVLVALAKV